MNVYAIRAIYLFELARTWRTLLQSIATPVISTSLYFVVFGSAIGARMEAMHGIPYGCLLYTSPSPRDRQKSRMPSSA